MLILSAHFSHPIFKTHSYSSYLSNTDSADASNTCMKTFQPCCRTNHNTHTICYGSLHLSPQIMIPLMTHLFTSPPVQPSTRVSGARLPPNNNSRPNHPYTGTDTSNDLQERLPATFPHRYPMHPPRFPCHLSAIGAYAMGYIVQSVAS